MLKNYTWVVGMILSLSGVMAMFWQPVRLPFFQATIHFVVGFVGVAAALRSFSSRYIKLLSMAGILLAILAFIGVNSILNLWQFDIFWKWFYLILGLLSTWVYLSTKPKIY